MPSAIAWITSEDKGDQNSWIPSATRLPANRPERETHSPRAGPASATLSAVVFARTALEVRYVREHAEGEAYCARRSRKRSQLSPVCPVHIVDSHDPMIVAVADIDLAQ